MTEATEHARTRLISSCDSLLFQIVFLCSSQHQAHLKRLDSRAPPKVRLSTTLTITQTEICCCCCCCVASVVSDSLQPHRRKPTRLPRPWDSPGKNTGVGCHFLLQYMKVKSEREVAQSCPTLSDSTDYSLPGSCVHGTFQARVLEWGAIAFSTERDIEAQKSLYFKHGYTADL